MHQIAEEKELSKIKDNWSGLPAKDLKSLVEAVTLPTPLVQHEVLGLLQVLRGQDSESMVALRTHAESRDYDSIRSMFSDLDSVGNDPPPSRSALSSEET